MGGGMFKRHNLSADAKRGARLGFTLLDVAIATVVLTIGTLGASRFFTGLYDQLSPRGGQGGLRRYLLAEEMLRAQAEGLRSLREIPTTDVQCKLVTEPPGMGYSMILSRTQAPTQPTEQLYYYDLTMSHQGQVIAQLSLSTVRAIGDLRGQDEKIGL